MSWPSFYGYKYTPIGLRQREVKDESGAKTYSTTVHLPEGGHLLDIERRFNNDGSVSKRETNCFAPNIPECRCATPPPRSVPRAVTPYLDEDFRVPISGLDRQADDIIANFRARQGTGLDQVGQSCLCATADQEATRQSSIMSSSRKMVSRESSSREESSMLASSRNVRREAKRLMDVNF